MTLVAAATLEKILSTSKFYAATHSDIGGCKEQIEKMREVVELPMLHPEKFVRLGIDPPKVCEKERKKDYAKVCEHCALWAHS